MSVLSCAKLELLRHAIQQNSESLAIVLSYRPPPFAVAGSLHTHPKSINTDTSIVPTTLEFMREPIPPAQPGEEAGHCRVSVQ